MTVTEGSVRHLTKVRVGPNYVIFSLQVQYSVLVLLDKTVQVRCYDECTSLPSIQGLKDRRKGFGTRRLRRIRVDAAETNDNDQ